MEVEKTSGVEFWEGKLRGAQARQPILLEDRDNLIRNAVSLEATANEISGALWNAWAAQEAAAIAGGFRVLAEELAEEQRRLDLSEAKKRRELGALAAAKVEASQLLALAPSCRRAGRPIPLAEINARLPRWLEERAAQILGGPPPTKDLIYGNCG